MQHSTKGERYCLCNDLRCFVLNYHLQVHMPIQECMHWLVPLTVELLKGCRVPPVLVKLSMVQAGDFRKEISETLENHYEHHHN